MTVYLPPHFEAEAIDLERLPDESEFFPDDPFHTLDGYDGEIRLIGTRRKYKVGLQIWADSDGIVCVDFRASEFAHKYLPDHVEKGGLITVTIGAVSFTARVTMIRDCELPTIADLFRHEPIDWGLRGDPYLWKDMRDHFRDRLLPESAEQLDRYVSAAFKELTGASIDSKEPIFNAQYDMGGMSSGHIDPQFWRTTALKHLREQLAYDKGWKRPGCPDCGSEDVAKIVYGYPGLGMIDDEQEGRIKLGGCCVTENDPEWHCWQCGREW